MCTVICDKILSVALFHCLDLCPDLKLIDPGTVNINGVREHIGDAGNSLAVDRGLDICKADKIIIIVSGDLYKLIKDDEIPPRRIMRAFEFVNVIERRAKAKRTGAFLDDVSLIISLAVIPASTIVKTAVPPTACDLRDVVKLFVQDNFKEISKRFWRDHVTLIAHILDHCIIKLMHHHAEQQALPAKCIGGGLVVDYQCDNLNGNVCAQVKVITPPNQKGTRRQFVAAVASGNAAYHIPVTGNDNGTGEILGSLKQAAVGMITGSVGSVAGAALDLGLDTAKHTTSVSGSLAGNVGYLGSLDVILEITYGDYYSTDGEYPATVGRPSYVQGAVKEFSGFCQFKAHTESIDGATDPEKQEIARLLEQGIIVNVTE